MSVKMMTTEQIHGNLSQINKMWPGGIPVEQNDQINALKAELKRRGVVAQEYKPEEPAPRGANEMSDEQLAKELHSLSERISKNPNDEALQTRFADIRWELRNRSKNGNGQSEPKVTGAFDPATGETFKSQLANGNGSSFQDGAVSRHTAEMPRRIDVRDPSAEQAAAEQMRANFLEAQALNVAKMEQAVRKHHLGKVAADVAATILVKFADPNGDDIENACTIGVQVATNVFAKVGL